jgi:glyoxylase-like metal-dependent hydrolase (beta-lactamase superfamily II)
MAREPAELGGGVRLFQTPLWQTNCLLAQAGGEVLLCDPSYTQEEIEELAREVASAGGSQVHVLVTHADYDHVCGLGSFPGAAVVAIEGTAARVEDGSAATELAAAAEEWGIPWQLEGVRVDRVVPAGEVQLGAFRVDVVDAPSHGREGAGFVLVDQGVLFPGDHLSPITIPLLAGSLAATISATEALLAALARHELRWVVPGHGRALSPAEAREIGEADLAYLRRLHDAAAEAVEAGLAPGWALLHVFAVEPPRADSDDFAVYGIRPGNAQIALNEARGGQ